MLRTWEIFETIDGQPLVTIRGPKWLARLATWALGRVSGRWLDYAPPGEGW